MRGSTRWRPGRLGGAGRRCRPGFRDRRERAGRGRDAGDARTPRPVRPVSRRSAIRRARRYRYPFTNCTHCGPRFTIIEGAALRPGARPRWRRSRCARTAGRNTSIRATGGSMPSRSPARPAARGLWLERGGSRCAGDAVDLAAAAILWPGEIVAMKGLGGFHLACDATNAEAVARAARAQAPPGEAVCADGRRRR